MKNLGKVLGYCPKCYVAVGQEELGCHCSKCGSVLHLDRLLKDIEVEIRQSRRQSAMGRNITIMQPKFTAKQQRELKALDGYYGH